MSHRLEKITPTVVITYRLMKHISTPMTVDEIIREFVKYGVTLTEWEFRSHVRRLIEVGAVQILGDRYLLRDTGALFCRKIEEMAERAT